MSLSPEGHDSQQMVLTKQAGLIRARETGPSFTLSPHACSSGGQFLQNILKGDEFWL